ncbi:hypothetical protein [Methylobacterium variabile]|uniref:hypothetical protein n=1 Tax=Methylobacterium variabile TaxID=298794 RepID=UPI0009FA7764|nr:hypothetical protein [Methylobacterium variabile]
MAFVTLKDWRSRLAANAPHSAALKARLTPMLELGPNDCLSVSEISCGDPDCPDIETVVLVMRAGEQSRAVHIFRALSEVDDADLAAACAEERQRRSAQLP